MITPISQVMVQKSFRFLLQSRAAITREVTRSRKHLRVRGGLKLGLGGDDAKGDIRRIYVGRGENKGRGRHKKFITTEEAY